MLSTQAYAEKVNLCQDQVIEFSNSTTAIKGNEVIKTCLKQLGTETYKLTTFGIIGWVYLQVGAYDQSIDYYQKALSAKMNKTTQAELANLYFNLGNANAQKASQLTIKGSKDCKKFAIQSNQNLELAKKHGLDDEKMLAYLRGINATCFQDWKTVLEQTKRACDLGYGCPDYYNFLELHSPK